MSHKHAKIIEDIFADPPSGNIHWRDVESLLNHLQAEILSHGTMLHVKLDGVEGMVHRPHHGSTLSKQDVRHLREWLHAAGVGS